MGEYPNFRRIKGGTAHFWTFQIKNLKANMQLRYLIFTFGFASGGHVRPLNIPPITLNHSAEQETFRKSSWNFQCFHNIEKMLWICNKLFHGEKSEDNELSVSDTCLKCIVSLHQSLVAQEHKLLHNKLHDITAYSSSSLSQGNKDGLLCPCTPDMFWEVWVFIHSIKQK